MKGGLFSLLLLLQPRELGNNDIIQGLDLMRSEWIELVVDQIDDKSGGHCRRTNNHLSIPETCLINVRTF